MNLDAGISIISSYKHAHMQRKLFNPGHTFSSAGVVAIVENSDKSLPLWKHTGPECYQHFGNTDCTPS